MEQSELSIVSRRMETAPVDLKAIFSDLGRVDKGDSQEGEYLIQGGFWGSCRDPRFDERRGMGLP